MNKFLLNSYIFLICLCSCTNNEKYSVYVKSYEGIRADTAYLYIYEPTYKKVRLIDKEYISPTVAAHFTGTYNDKRLAYIKLNGKSSTSYYFSLDSITTSLWVGDGKMSVRYGSNDNQEIIRISQIIKTQEKNKQNIKAQYKKAYISNKLNTDNEAKMLNKLRESDSIIEVNLLKYIESDSPISYILWRRYGHYLPLSKIPSKYNNKADN